jgi:hypothetical protein
MYYRVAIQVDPLPTWQWRSTVLSSLQTLFQFLQVYRAFPQDRLPLQLHLAKLRATSPHVDEAPIAHT